MITKDEAVEAAEVVQAYLARYVNEVNANVEGAYDRFDIIKTESDWVEITNLLRRLRENY